jgi:hypothetical protein
MQIAQVRTGLVYKWYALRTQCAPSTVPMAPKCLKGLN